MLAHCLYVLGALTGIKLEWKSPPRGDNALGWGDAARRVGTLIALPLAIGFGVLRRALVIAMAPMLLPLTLAVPFTVLTGHPRAGRAVARLGLMRTPEEASPPPPLLRAAERASFVDLVPPPAPAPRSVPPAPRHHGHRFVPVAMAAAVALVAIGAPSPGLTPGLSPQSRVEHELNLTAYWRELPSLQPVQAQAPVRKRVVARDSKPARMIDNALRQRALEAVERAIANEAPPT
jgi:membrane glycosyltransferase